MPFFKKKPVVIEARQYNGTAPSANGIIGWLAPYGALAAHNEHGTFGISTLEGVMTVSSGDWVIRGVKNEFYPCRNDIFVATYEPVEPTASIGVPE